MSFGFSVGDFTGAIAIANKLWKAFVKAPRQFKAISDEVERLSIVLRDTDVAFPNWELDNDQKRDLEEIDKSCRNILDELQQILNKNKELISDNGNISKRIKRIWKRLNWNPEDVNELRSRLNTNVNLLSLFNVRDMRGNIIKLVRYQEDQTRQIVFDWITPFDYAPRQNGLIARRQEGTGQWLLDSNEFQTWLGIGKQTLFCQGIPGAGKTILTSIVVEELINSFQNNKSIGIAYLYCDFKPQNEQNVSDLFASLLKQLTRGQSSIPDTVKSLYDKHKNSKTRPLFAEIFTTIQVVVSMYSRTFIVIDALDEYRASHSGWGTFLSELFSLQTKCGINLFITSRFIPEITAKFQGSLLLEIRATEHDVRRYIDGHISHLPSFIQRSPQLQEEVKTEIVKVIDGMFLLGELHVKSLKGKTTVKAMRAALKKLPVGYDDAYKDVMVRIKGQGREKEELAEQVLSWIACAERPLTILELQYALAVEVGESELDKDNLREIEDIISVCSGLVTIDKASNVIRLVHYTAQEFFERTQSHWFQNANTYITTICTTYLSFDAFERGLCQTEDEFENRLRSNNFFEYAAQNWGHHARKATTLSQALSHAVVDFLMSEAKVDASSQGLLGINSYLPYSYHNQNNPRKMTGLHLTAYFGAEAVVKLLLKTGKVDGDSKDNGGRTSLSWAAQNGHEAVVKLLLETGKVDADSKDDEGRTSLSWAAQNGHEAIVKLLLGTGKVDADSKDDGGWTPLSWAAGNGQEAVVKLLFATGKVDADSKDKCNETPLSWAAGNGHEAIVKLLLATDKVDANSKDDEGWTPRSHAAQNGHETIVKLLQARELRAMT